MREAECQSVAALRKLSAHPEWRRGNAPKLFVDGGYLASWRSAAEPGDALARKPATEVSWFAATAYCEAQGKRLPRLKVSVDANSPGLTLAPLASGHVFVVQKCPR